MWGSAMDLSPGWVLLLVFFILEALDRFSVTRAGIDLLQQLLDPKRPNQTENE